VLTQGQNVDDLKTEIEGSIEGLCDGALCVTVATDKTAGDCLQTTTPHWDDSGNVTIDKSTPGFPSTLTLIGGPGVCPPVGSTSPSVIPSEPTDTTSEPTDDATSPADTSTGDPSADAASP
jgi:hypothetical protein